MADEKRRVGRPRTRLDEAPGDFVGFRAPRELKEKLKQAAASSGRSLSTEAQFRLEKSFHPEELLAETLELAFGPGLAGLLTLAGRVMREAGSSKMYQKQRDGGVSGGSWPMDPDAYNEAVRAAHAVLEEWRPDGAVDPASTGSIAARFAADRIDWVVNQGAPYPFGERKWIDLTRALLGDLLAQSKSLHAQSRKDDAAMAAMAARSAMQTEETKR
jgi:TraY domain